MARPRTRVTPARLLLLAIAAALVGGAVSAEARPLHSSAYMQCRNYGNGLQRCEGRYFICWTPTRWLAVESQNGLDISSPTGTFYVGFAFSRWYRPVTFDGLLRYFLQVQRRFGRGIDLHPLTAIRFTSRGRPYPWGIWERQISTWTARRTDRGERVRGVLTIDIHNDPGTFYGDEGFSRVAPVARWRTMARTLLYVQNHIKYKPFAS